VRFRWGFLVAILVLTGRTTPKSGISHFNLTGTTSCPGTMLRNLRRRKSRMLGKIDLASYSTIAQVGSRPFRSLKLAAVAAMKTMKAKAAVAAMKTMKAMKAFKAMKTMKAMKAMKAPSAVW